MTGSDGIETVDGVGAAEVYVLTAEELAVLREYEAAGRNLEIAAGRIEAQFQGSMRMILRQQGLAGDWSFAGDRLVKQPKAEG